MSKNPSVTVKIGEAAKALGVSIKTLRRWEASGKISSVRTPGGTRLYSVSELEEKKLSFEKPLEVAPKPLKIGDVSKSLGVSVKTLRRWEQKGRISSVRTTGGTRIYSQDEIERVKSVKLPQSTSLSTAELLEKIEKEDIAEIKLPDFSSVIT